MTLSNSTWNEDQSAKFDLNVNLPKNCQLQNKEAIWLYAELFLGISKYIIYLVEIILDYFAVVPSSALISPIFFEDNQAFCICYLFWQFWDQRKTVSESICISYMDVGYSEMIFILPFGGPHYSSN